MTSFLQKTLNVQDVFSKEQNGKLISDKFL